MDPYVQDEHTDLAVAGQIIACGLCAMRVLQMCMKPDITPTEMARLSRTADTLGRTAQRHRGSGLYLAPPKPARATPQPNLRAVAAPETAPETAPPPVAPPKAEVPAPAPQSPKPANMVSPPVPKDMAKLARIKKEVITEVMEEMKASQPVPSPAIPSTDANAAIGSLRDRALASSSLTPPRS
jgi:hypothetical protein